MAQIGTSRTAVMITLLSLVTGNVRDVWARNADKATDDKTIGNKSADNGTKAPGDPGASANVVPTANAPSRGR